MRIEKENLKLENDRMYLRPLKIEDINDEYISGLNDPEVNKYLANVRQNVQTKETVEQYVHFNLESPSCILFGIFLKNCSKPFIGTVRISRIDFFHYISSIGICLFAKRAWKKAYALQAIQLVKEYSFKTIGLHYIEAGVLADNENSKNLFLRAEFSEKYRIREKYRHIDRFKEVIFYGAINSSFDISLLQHP